MGASTSISVLGSGSWGTALAILLARNGIDTLLWGYDAEEVKSIQQERQNHRYLPGIELPERLEATNSLEQAVSGQQLLLIAVPSHAFRTTLETLKPFAHPELRLCWATKGLDKSSGGLLSATAKEILGPETPLAIISGPSFAKEVAENLPTALTVASPESGFAGEIAALLHNERFRAYSSNDIVGAQIGGAVKNVMAIAAGISDGLDFGANTRVALITRGLAEMMRLGIALGGSAETFMGLAGMGDLVLTCTDNQSRNRRMGIGLGKGLPADEVKSEIGQEVEGILAAKEVYQLSKKLNVEMPITEQVYKVLYESLPPQQAVHNLLSREQKPEISFS